MRQDVSMGVPFAEVRESSIEYLVAQARLLTRDPDLDVTVTIGAYPDPIDHRTEYRFVIQVPARYRGLLIGRKGHTADALRSLLRTYVNSQDCFEDIDLRVRRDD